jgi:hypothetical protein
VAEALNIKLYLTPMKHQIERVVSETAIRVRTGTRPRHTRKCNKPIYSGEDQARRVNPYQGSDDEEGWRIIITIQN